MIAAAVTNIKPAAIPSMTHSSQVSSKQSHIHPRLPVMVRRHLASRHLKPVAAHDRQAFDRLRMRLEDAERPLVLDSFCGTGHSTALLAARHPDHLVVGIDKSASRLARHPGGSRPDYLLLQADCEPLWLLLAEAGIKVGYHYLLYPNPWPKSRHLQRRVHGHPGFAALLQLGGRVELRSNWQLYVEEFGMATHLAGFHGRVATLGATDNTHEHADLTLFEKKYRLSGHTLWTFQADLGSGATAVSP